MKCINLHDLTCSIQMLEILTDLSQFLLKNPLCSGVICFHINQLPFILYFHPCRPGCQILGVASLLRKYCSLLVSHVSGIMPTATSVGDMSDRSFAATCAVLSRDVTGKCIGILSMF